MNKFLTVLLLLVVIVAAACQPGKNDAKADEGDGFKLAAVNDIVMYQVNPRVFAPEKSIVAVTQRLDSIKALGVNVIWVMPIYPIGKEKTKNSPYSIRDYKAIAEEFGTIDEFKALVDSCHAKGMGIILDWVANHTAWDAVWLKDQGHKDWYTQDENGNVIYTPNTDWTDVADLNYDNKDMRAAMIDAMKYWIVDIGIDGFRCDVADWVPVDFWKDALSQLRAAVGDRQLVFLAEGNNPETINDGGFNMNYGWDYRGQLNKVFQKNEPASSLFEADKKEYENLKADKVKLRFTTNHDESTKETPVVDYGGERGSMAAYVATVFPHGGALIYSSQEVAFPTPINFFKYVPVDWSAHGDIYKEYQHLISLINQYPTLRHGAPSATFPDNDILAFERNGDDGEFLILVNVRNAEHTLALPQAWAAAKVTNLADDKQITLDKEAKLAPFQYMILKK